MMMMINPMRVYLVASRMFGVTMEVMASKTRRAGVVEARFFVWKLLYEKYLLSYDKIGRTCGDRAHTTVMSGVREITNRIETDARTEKKWQSFIEEVEKVVPTSNRRISADTDGTNITIHHSQLGKIEGTFSSAREDAAYVLCDIINSTP